MQKAKLFVALDFAEQKNAWDFFQKTKTVNPYFKVGLELFSSAGPAFVNELIANGAEVFLDLKFHDIPNTVSGAIRAATRLRIGWVNVHCGGGSEMLLAAKDAAKAEANKLGIPVPKVLGVTVLTSLNDLAVQEIGFPRSASAQVKHFLDLAMAAKLDGIVCSAEELPLVRNCAGKEFITMVPGIRPIGSDKGDQQRVTTVQEAVKRGATCIVMGRPITQAADPILALEQALRDL